MAQTVFNVNPPAGLPGMPFDNGPLEVRSFPAASAIKFGTLCEFTTVGGLRAVQMVNDAGTAGSFLPVLAGIALYNPEREQNYVGQGATPGNGYYQAGEMVPCVRRGRVWAQIDAGGTWPEYAAVRVWHSSTGASPQGVFTMTAAQTTAGSEIDLAPSCIGVEKALVQTAYTDFSGDAILAGVVSINLAP